MIIKSPSGLVCECRKFRGEDLNNVADKMSESDEIPGGILTTLLSSAWIGVVEPGIYNCSPGNGHRPEWNVLLKSDLLSLLFKLRIASFRDGKVYDFPVKCDSCGKRYEWEIDLEKVMIAGERELPEATKKAIKAQEQLVATIPSGAVVKYELWRLADDPEANTLRRRLIKSGHRKKNRSTIVDVLAQQLRSVDGVPRRGAEAWLWLNALDLDDLYSLRDQVGGSDGGYDAEIRTECEHCGWLQDVQLPLVRSFLDPRPKSRTTKLITQSQSEVTKDPEATTTTPAATISTTTPTPTESQDGQPPPAT